jgi:hypothetical protein
MTANDEPGATRVGTWNERETARPGNGHRPGGAVEMDGVRHDPNERRDRARWGPIWAGSLITVLIFIILQTFFFALGWLDLGFDAGSSQLAAATVSGVLALISFFIGGLAAASWSMWRSVRSGMVEGISVWALTNVGILILALLGGGALLGSLGSFVTQLGTLQQLQGANVPLDQLTNSVRNAAGATSLYLGVTALFAALGGMTGAKIWPGQESAGEDR